MLINRINLVRRAWIALAVNVLILPLTIVARQESVPSPQTPAIPTDQPSKFDGEAAFEYLKEICEFGPRVSASRGMKKQQEYIEQQIEKIGGKLYNQPFRVRSPYPPNRNVELHNLIVQYHPDRKQRLMICCHYDTRPFADRDPNNVRAKFLGANDGASGVGLLLELGKHLVDMEGPYGVDLVFFDGEEFVIDKRVHPMFLGSTWFAQQYADNKIPWKYEYAVLVDMIADKDLQLYYEGNSLGDADRLTRSIWSVAAELGIKEFIPEKRHTIRDDHLPLNQIAKIPTCDIIDFDFPNPEQGNIYWHTLEDNVDNCSADSLQKVGSVVLEWIRQMQKLEPNPDANQPIRQP